MTARDSPLAQPDVSRARLSYPFGYSGLWACSEICVAMVVPQISRAKLSTQVVRTHWVAVFILETSQLR
ncbi:hypothetical protein CH92_13535 [Stutzerimonas stutzeri]|uniref:Uncharacterized protein n=1 Tax=Stutzerimonas stutzeri TaxID=316 RepID=W8R4T8_STUST|nr:hypothetical protein CH92_13535 [Stutzerimonas stutzeri]